MEQIPITFRPTPQLREKLAKFVKETGVPKSKVIREAIEMYIASPRRVAEAPQPPAAPKSKKAKQA